MDTLVRPDNPIPPGASTVHHMVDEDVYNAHARWSRLVQWSSEPALHTRLHLGKYRGQRYDAIAASDPDYLRGSLQKSELEEPSAQRAARYWLATIASDSTPRCARYRLAAVQATPLKP